MSHTIHLAQCLLQQMTGQPKPDPEVAAAQFGLELRPVVGATYSFDGQTITYDARAPREQQLLCISRAVLCKVHERRMTDMPPLGEVSLRKLFRFS